MTKSLTEQWREGKLPAGHYYCKLYYSGFKPRIQECVKSRYDSKSCIPMSCGCDGEEVLAPVPSYSEYQALKDNCELTHTRLKGTHQKIAQLKKKIGIATKALEELETKSDKFDNSWSIQEQLDFIKAKCQETLYQIK